MLTLFLLVRGTVLHTHPVRGESHIHHKANREAAILATRLA